MSWNGMLTEEILLTIKVPEMSQEKQEALCYWAAGWTSFLVCFGKTFLLERMTGRHADDSDFDVWQTFFSKMNNAKMSLQAKQLSVFVASDKIWTFKRQLEKTCLMRSAVRLTSVVFWHYTIEHISIF